MKEMPKDSKVKMNLENVEVFGNLAEGMICCVCEPSPILISLKKERKDFSYK